MNKRFSTIILAILLLFLTLFFIRLILPKEIDDVSLEIPCLEKYLKKSNILWIIPKFNNKSIAENQEWCNYILNLNKTLGLHGVYHKVEEFNTDRNQEYLQEGINAFEGCFGFKPEIFKPPQLKISKGNKQLIKKNNMKLKTRFNQLLHKVYHCSDSGNFPNWLINLI